MTSSDKPQKIYFVQVEGGTPDNMQQVVDSLGGFLDTEDAEAIAVPELVEPLSRDEVKQYLEGLADAVDMEVEDK